MINWISANRWHKVVPHAGTWIEIPITGSITPFNSVVPHAGTWIEITTSVRTWLISKSFPTRERGLKYCFLRSASHRQKVVPHAGTWIEILSELYLSNNSSVVPHAGTWIEINRILNLGLSGIVVPHAGTWIEICVRVWETHT